MALDKVTRVDENISAIQTNKTLLSSGSNIVEATSGPNSSAFAFRNKLINGGCMVDQRGNYVHTTSGSTYGGPDRWMTSISATTVSAISLLVPIAQATSGYAFQIGNVLTTGTTMVSIHQKIESINAKCLRGKTVTFSGKVLHSAPTNLTLDVTMFSPTGVDDYVVSDGINGYSIDVPPNTTTTFKLTTNLVIDGGYEVRNGLAVSLGYSNMAAQTNTQFYFYDLQLEEGSVATPFENRPYGLELALCQRYYETVGLAGIAGSNYGTANTRANWNFKVVKRHSTPTIVAIVPSTGILENLDKYSARLVMTGAGFPFWAPGSYASAEI